MDFEILFSVFFGTLLCLEMVRLIIDNMKIYDDTENVLGLVNAYAVIFGTVLAFVCSLNIVTAIIASLLSALMLTLSIVCLSGSMWLIIRNVTMWSINLVTTLFYFF